MPRKVSLEQLQARKAQMQARIAREQKAVATLARQAAQAEGAAWRARWCALGEVVDAVYGTITPADLHAVLALRTAGTAQGHDAIDRPRTPADLHAVRCTLATLALLIQEAGHGDTTPACLHAVCRPLTPGRGAEHDGVHSHRALEGLNAVRCSRAAGTDQGQETVYGALTATSLTDLFGTLQAIALLVHEAVDGHLTPEGLTTLRCTVESLTPSVPKNDMGDTSFPLWETTQPQKSPPEVAAKPGAFRQRVDGRRADNTLPEGA